MIVEDVLAGHERFPVTPANRLGANTVLARLAQASPSTLREFPK
jgi:hypothetical protein